MPNRENGTMHAREKNMLMIYDPKGDRFIYPAIMAEHFDLRPDGRPVWQMLEEDGVSAEETARKIQKKLGEIIAADEPRACFEEYLLRDRERQWRWYRMGFINAGPDARIAITLTDISGESCETGMVSPAAESDALTELISAGNIAERLERMLKGKQFIAYYQPQYNHSTGMLVGAEALARWNHPCRGLLSPDVFIPFFERMGMISRLDLCIFEQACVFLKNCMDKGLPLVPVSVNFSRGDIFRPDFAEKLEEIRIKQGVPVKYLRVEITESVLAGSAAEANAAIAKLHQYGYIVEMDDFGSGYSSLNALKDIDFDLLKMDMMFLSENPGSNRGGTIVSSVVRMAKWLGLPVIAEGVETLRQADFLKSIGCDYVQGYLYSRPVPPAEMEKILAKSEVGEAVPQLKLIENLDPADFWNPESQETLIFSNYVGGAAIFAYHGDQVEILRVNRKYIQEIGMNHSEKELIQSDPLAVFDDINRKVYLDMLDRAILSGEEQECEAWRTLSSSCCGDERVCIRSSVRMIGDSGETKLFYAMIRNITAERTHFNQMMASEHRFKMASEQVNIYYWEYTVATREMRPCFRCMRDLGLPALLINYPDSAIEMGVFPPEVADMYRDWHIQIANGAKELEAVIPLTVGRIPFRVRYTTEFDEAGRPIKAYGSAALVVE